MFIKSIFGDYREDERLKLCESLVFLVLIDGEVDDTKKEKIKAIYAEAGFEKEFKKINFSLLKKSMGFDDVMGANERFLNLIEPYDYDKEKCKMYVFELLSVCLCDGNYDETEKEIINSVIAAVEIDSIIVSQMIDSIKIIMSLYNKANTIVLSEEI